MTIVCLWYWRPVIPFTSDITGLLIHTETYFSYQHLTGRGEIVSCERIEIDTTRDSFTECISAVPISSTVLAFIDTDRLIP